MLGKGAERAILVPSGSIIKLICSIISKCCSSTSSTCTYVGVPVSLHGASGNLQKVDIDVASLAQVLVQL